MEPLVCHDCTNPILVLKHLLNEVEYKMKNNEDRGECSAEVDNTPALLDLRNSSYDTKAEFCYSFSIS